MTFSDSSSWLLGQVGRGIGPYGGEIRALGAARSNPDRLYAGTASGQIFVTGDGAGRWQDCRVPLPPGAFLSRLAVHPLSPDTAYATYWVSAGGGGLLRTRDGGARWEKLPIPDSPALRTVAISPSQPETLYVGGPAGVWRSNDGGDSWVYAGGKGRHVREVESLVVDPRSPSRVSAGTWRQPYRSLDGGETWSLIARGMDIDRDVFTITISPHDPESVFAGTCGFLYASKDGGDLWMSRKNGIPMHHRRIHTIWVDPVEPREVWLGTRGGIYRSQDGAVNFSLIYPGISVSALVSDEKGDHLYAGTEELGVLAKRKGSGLGFRESNLGLNASRVAAFDATQGDLKELFAACTERPGRQAIQVSRDSGRTWSKLGEQLRFEKVRFLRAIGLPTTALLVIDEAGRWWRVGMDGRSQPLVPPAGRLAAIRVIPSQDLVIAATDSGLFLSRPDEIPPAGSKVKAKGEPAWRKVYSGALQALATRGDKLLALGPGRAVKGNAWALYGGEPAEEIRCWGLPGGLVDAAIGPDGDDTALAITRTQVLLSEDGGATWASDLPPWPAKDLRAVGIDPGKPGRVVALEERGILFVRDGRGSPWFTLNDGANLDMAQDFRLSETVPGIVLVATLGHGLRVMNLELPGATTASFTPKP